jgi:hypothetical protein
MAIYGLPDGTQAEFPDTMSEDEVKAVLRKKFPAPVDPQAGAKSVVAEMGPVEGAVTAFGENARHALRKAANFSLPHTFKSLGNRDEDVAAESAALAPLNAAFPKSAMAGGLSINVPAAVLTPGGKIKAAGLVPRALRMAIQAVEGGAQGAAFADPESRATEGAIGALAGPVFEGVGQVGRGIMNFAKPYANRTALKIIEPTRNALNDIIDNYGKKGGLISDAFETAGEKLRQIGVAKPFKSMSERHRVVADYADVVNPKLKATVDALDQQGATVDTKSLIAELEAARDAMFTRPGSESLTEPLRLGRRHADDLINRVRAHPGLQPGAKLSQFEDAKRVLQDEGFLTGSANYINSQAASMDPTVSYMRKASSAFKRAGEAGADAVDPVLGAEFKTLKGQSQLGKIGSDSAKEAAISDFASNREGPMGMTHVMPQTLPERTLTNTVLSHARPLSVTGAEITDWLGRMTPNELSTALRAATVEALRSKERAQ